MFGLERTEGGGRIPRTRFRRHELQHLLRSAGPGAQLQVRQPHAHRPGHAGAGRGTQPRMHRDRQGVGQHGAHGVDRRRQQLPRTATFPPRVRPVSRQRQADLRRPAGTLADVPGAQDLRAGLLRDGDPGLGIELPRRHRDRPQGAVPRRPRASRAERQHRADRRPARRGGTAGRLPLQRQQVR